ncbi:MAG: GTPase HflX [Gammaproteobacteria bacterium]|nr:GTPase HflX [Gammaproteobacteria bacterium]
MFFDRPEAGLEAMLLSLRFDHSKTPHNLAEFSELTRSAGYVPKVELAITRHEPNPRTGLGSGKVAELREELDFHDLTLVIIDCELTASQNRNLELALERRVLTRTELILTIFEQRAQTREGKLQVELALLRHAQTHVVGGWSHLDRQRGGINMRGAGELQSAIDKGLIQRRILSVEKRLEKVVQHREQHRKRRHRNDILTVALVGYTNAGKSTLFNALTESEVYADDRLFATLDPTMRRLALPNVGTGLLADTVGFIRDLPMSLVAAFKATLEEVSHADLLLHVIDASAADAGRMVHDVQDILTEIGAGEIPTINVLNKVDQGLHPNVACMTGVRVSALERTGFDELRGALGAQLGGITQLFEVHLPASAGKLRAWLYGLGAVKDERYESDGTATLCVKLNETSLTRLRSSPGVALEPVVSAT